MYLIVLFEKSPAAFHNPKLSGSYLHHVKQHADTGLEMNFLEEYFLIPLDIFRKVLYNRGIKSDLDAWLTLLSVDEPEWIIRLLDTYPQFKPVYEQAYDLCRNIEGVMDMFFSEELRILDANTVHIMVDEMQEELDKLTNENEEQNKIILAQREFAKRQAAEIEKLKKQLEEK